MAHKSRLSPYFLVAPALLFFGVFFLYPFGKSIWISCFRWNGVSEGVWVGFGNYVEIFLDPLSSSALLHALILALIYSTVPVAIGLILAHVFVTIPVRGATAFRVLIFLPNVISLVAVAVIWSWLLATDGPINQLLRIIGLGALVTPWLADFNTALSTVGVVGVWSLIGMCMVMFTAAVQQISSSLYDAVKIDRGGRVREFWAVTVPGLRSQIGLVLILTVIGALRTFDLVFVLTRGGPGTQTVTPGLMLYNRAFVDGRVGQSTAIAVVLAILVIGVTVAIDRVASHDLGRHR